MKNTLDFNNPLKKRKSGWRGDSESDNRQYTRTNYRNIRKKISDHFTSFKSGYTCTLICYFVLAVVLVGILMVVLRGNNGDIGKGRSAVYYDNDNITNAADQLIIQELEEGDFFLQTVSCSWWLCCSYWSSFFLYLFLSFFFSIFPSVCLSFFSVCLSFFLSFLLPFCFLFFYLSFFLSCPAS